MVDRGNSRFRGRARPGDLRGRGRRAGAGEGEASFEAAGLSVRRIPGQRPDRSRCPGPVSRLGWARAGGGEGRPSGCSPVGDWPGSAGLRVRLSRSAREAWRNSDGGLSSGAEPRTTSLPLPAATRGLPVAPRRRGSAGIRRTSCPESAAGCFGPLARSRPSRGRSGDGR